ncbi:MAG: hypothetical protein KDA60_06035 [Planctomycetales bacterium]|nr:hypothetical protein [Planctomycetales bacterium]
MYAERFPSLSLIACVLVSGLSGSCFPLASTYAAEPATTATIAVGSQAKAISPDLLGIFYEDINYAADGGLYAELVQNRSFEYGRGDNRAWDSLTAWEVVQLGGAQASVSIGTATPLHPNNPHYAVLAVEQVGDGVGLQNNGFDGIAVKSGDKYDVTVFARVMSGAPGTLVVRVVSDSGKSLGEVRFGDLSEDAWTKHTATITANSDSTTARLVLLVSGPGEVALDMVSLFPQQTFHNRPNGLRSDLAQVIADLKPKFVRFPGGCLAHGDGLENMYRWKDTIGPIEQRKAQRNIWRYHQTMGLGYFEYFQFCEDIGAKPIPVVPAGVCCQNSGNYLDLVPRGQQGLPMALMPDYVQEVLDLIEWANGPATSEWGAKRAAAGHPEPFHLEYLGVGNEDAITPVFKERFLMIRDAVKAKYPEITVIGTTGWGTDGFDFDEGWKFANEINLAMVDEHGYKSPSWFWSNLERFDNFDRNRSQVYVGEYAAHEANRANTLRSAVSEAAYLTGLERNADHVIFASYAPLLSRVGHTQWRPDLIYFDNVSVTPSVNYYVQQLFGVHNGDQYLPTKVEVQAREPAQVAGSPNGVLLGSWDTQVAFDDVKVDSEGKTIVDATFDTETKVWKPISGRWQWTDGMYTQTGDDQPALSRLEFTSAPQGYTLTLRAKAIRGSEGFLVGFESPDSENYYWLNIGGWGNTLHRLEKTAGGAKTPIGPAVSGRIEYDRWYEVKVVVQGKQIECFLDGKSLLSFEDDSPVLAASTIRDTKSGDLILKIASQSDTPLKTQIDLSALGLSKSQARRIVLTGDPLAVNRFGREPEVLPQESTIDVSPVFEYTVPAHSFSVIRIR